MSEHGFLRVSEWAGWSVCPGRPWLEDNHPAPVPDPISESEECLNRLKARVQTHQDATASVQIITDTRLDLSVITGERHANATAWRVVVAQYADHSTLEVWQPGASEEELQFLGFAAFLQHALLHHFTSIALVGDSEWIRVPDELYVFGQRVTEAAHLALSIQGEPETSQLIVSDACSTCRALRSCPAARRQAALELV